jgi:ribosomal protein L37AE/L43A
MIEQIPLRVFPVLYRFVRLINAHYALAIFWVYVLAFVVAWALVFVFPLGPLLLLFIGLAGLGFAVIGMKIMEAVERALARSQIHQGICPVCREHALHERREDRTLHCDACHSAFQPGGAALASLATTQMSDQDLASG